MKRVAIDTNILVSYLFWPSSPIRTVLRDTLQFSQLLRSTETFAELAEVIMRPKFDAYYTGQEREQFLNDYYHSSQHILITHRIDACRDAKDNKFLELAVCGKASFLLTGDKDLLCLDPFQGIRILAPSALAG